MTLYERVAGRQPASIAVIDARSGVTWTTGDLLDAASKIEVPKGRRVVVSEPASPEMLARLLAIWAAGSTAVPLTAGLTERELRFFREHSSGDSSEALLLYTSGSTGDPKGVRLSHASVLASIESTIAHFGLDAGLRMLSLLDPSHGHGLLVTLLMPLVVGGAVVIEERFSAFSVSRFWQSCEAHGVNAFSSVPAVLRTLHRLTSTRAASVRLALCASAPLSPGFHRDFEERFVLPLHNNYGLTETATWVARGGRDGHVGVGVEGTLRIQDGEVQVRSPQNTLGYLDNAEANARLWDGEWLRTGDLGRLDEGRLVLLGRAKEVIDRGAEKVYPAEVEERLLEHPAVRTAAVVAGPSKHYGEEPVAFVVASAEPRALRDWCREGLAAYKVPKRVVVLEDLPRLRTGKIDKNALKGLV